MDMKILTIALWILIYTFAGVGLSVMPPFIPLVDTYITSTDCAFGFTVSEKKILYMILGVYTIFAPLVIFLWGATFLIYGSIIAILKKSNVITLGKYWRWLILYPLSIIGLLLITIILGYHAFA